MQSITQHIHNLVLKIKGEELLVKLRRWFAFTRKLIPIQLRSKFTSIGKLVPPASDYPTNDHYFLTRDNTQFVINRSDYVQWRVFYGVRDNALKAAKKYLEPNSVVLDIGASIGAFSLKLATYVTENKYRDIQIHAFEPNRLIAERYKRNLVMNPRLKNSIHFHSFGLGSEQEKKPFLFQNSNTGAGRVVQTNGQLAVAIQRLDDFVNALRPTKIAFIKLIVEGYEPKVLEGGWETIKKHKPPIFFEVTRTWWKENNATVEEVLNKLSSLGYRFMIEHHNEMFPYDPFKFSSRTQFNILATAN
jgi:FkbM family methyltransferase